MDGLRFLDVPGRSLTDPDRDDLVVWCRGPVERHSSAVLLVHDRLSNARAWDLVMQRLPAGVATVAVELRGRGSAWRQAPSLGLATHAADVLDVLDRLDIDDVLAVGHGFGAAVVSALCEASPDRVPLTVGVLANDPEDPFEAMLGMAYPNRDEHVRFWLDHPTLSAADPQGVASFVAHGIAGRSDHHRWRVDLRSLVPDDHDAAGRGLMPFTRSILMGAVDARGVAPVGQLSLRGQPAGSMMRLAEVNGFAGLLVKAGADAVAAQVRLLLG